MGKRSDFARRRSDAYHTFDQRAVQALKPYLYGIKTFAEPCAGDSDLIKGLKSIGLRCVLASDIATGVDALTISDFNGADAIITNPPWTRVLLHPLILHFQKHKPTWLLFDADWAFNKRSALYLEHCSHIVAVGRLKWIEGTTQTGKDNVAWYCFWHKHTAGPRFHGRSI